MMFQTEYEFELPRGYVDSTGTLHRRGVMRLATAADEIGSLKDPKVVQNQAYLTIAILSKVIVKLGALPQVSQEVCEKFFSVDMSYLQDFYQRINLEELPGYDVTCPHCQKKQTLPMDFFMEGPYSPTL